MVKLYGVPTCKQIQLSKKLFEQNNIEYEFINLKKTPISREKLQEMIAQLGLDAMVNSKGPTYRKLGLKEKKPADDELVLLLLEAQNMINRPLLEKEGRYWIAQKFDEQGMLDFLADQ